MGLLRGLLLCVVVGFCAMERFGVAGEERKVALSLYYETLCPYCSNFIAKSLSTIFTNGLSDIVQLHLVPYGNARLDPNRTISCQHGPNECLLNTVEACVISAFPDVHKHFPFIYCVENLVVEQKSAQWESCFQQTGLDPQTVADCYNSGNGEKLELQYAAETNALEPPLKFVPWVVVNGQPLKEDYQNFEAYICRSYKGDMPAACKSLPIEMQEKKPNQFKRVSYPKESRHPSTISVNQMKMEKPV